MVCWSLKPTVRLFRGYLIFCSRTCMRVMYLAYYHYIKKKINGGLNPRATPHTRFSRLKKNSATKRNLLHVSMAMGGHRSKEMRDSSSFSHTPKVNSYLMDTRLCLGRLNPFQVRTHLLWRFGTSVVLCPPYWPKLIIKLSPFLTWPVALLFVLATNYTWKCPWARESGPAGPSSGEYCTIILV